MSAIEKLIYAVLPDEGSSVTLGELCDALRASPATPPCFAPDSTAVWGACRASEVIGVDTGRGTIWRAV